MDLFTVSALMISQIAVLSAHLLMKALLNEFFLSSYPLVKKPNVS
jgi:hypothetical protein